MGGPGAGLDTGEPDEGEPDGAAVRSVAVLGDPEPADLGGDGPAVARAANVVGSTVSAGLAPAVGWARTASGRGGEKGEGEDAAHGGGGGGGSPPDGRFDAGRVRVHA